MNFISLCFDLYFCEIICFLIYKYYLCMKVFLKRKFLHMDADITRLVREKDLLENSLTLLRHLFYLNR